jgi:hypothetical protein
VRRVLLLVIGLLVLGAAGIVGALRGGRHEGPGTAQPARLPEAIVATRLAGQRVAGEQLPSGAMPARQILFGDLHVHTTFSGDAFQLSLPMMQGEGAHPPADACDFARYCSQLDFWSINDHAEGITPAHWRETKDAIRECNAVAGSPKSPDVVAFVGWEWTQVGATPEEHYGHKNVIFRDLAEDRLPARPIAAPGRFAAMMRRGFGRPSTWQRLAFPLFDFPRRQRYLDLAVFFAENAAVGECPHGVDTRQLPPDCWETAATPQELFEKLSQWGFDTIVIPHGTTWGFYTPPGSTLDKQLTVAQHDPGKQTLFEVYSGHGNSEEYRDWKAVDWDPAGTPVCPEPTRNYEPCCWRAGEIIRGRCGDVSAEECERRVREARMNYLAAGVAGHATIPGIGPEDWKDCGQCRDCFNPAFNYRPGSSAQYALAISNFDGPGPARRFRFGFIASSDNHSARPGTGYKEYGRLQMTEAKGPRSAAWRRRALGREPAPGPESVPVDPTVPGVPPFRLVDGERQASFFMTGGLVAVYSEGRSREAIWEGLKRREVYGTSGDRILLRFDLLNGPEGPRPMGAQVQLAVNPHFAVKAVGAFKQLPGCPEWSVRGLPGERLERLCRGECYNPSDERRRITRIEVVRVRPQVLGEEPVRLLIEDPWRRFDCPPDPAGCAVEFEDPEFLHGQRDAVYYVRAVQEPTPAVNAGGMRCEYDAEGQCVRAHPCYGDYRTPATDDCLTMNEERAWSSPIYVNRADVADAPG